MVAAALTMAGLQVFGGYTVATRPSPPIEGCLAILATGEVRVGGEAVGPSKTAQAVQALAAKPTTNLGLYTEFPRPEVSGVAWEKAIQRIYGDVLGPYLTRTKRSVQFIDSERPDCSDLSTQPATDAPE